MSSYFQSLGTMFGYLWAFAPIWLPIITGIVAWEMWLEYVRAMFAASKPKVLLEIMLPQEITKSPLAMEIVLTSLWITSRESTFFDRYFKGQSRPRFSLELASLGGKVHFYIWTEKDYVSIIETQIYSQFANIEVKQVDDYAKGVVYQPGVNQMFGLEFIKTAAADALPIKTYIDYGMDKDPKEEYKIDPMTSMLEFMGSIKQDEQVWFQINLRAHKDEKVIYRDGKRKKVGWKYFGEEVKKKMIADLKDKDNPTAPARRLTKSEDELIASIDRNVSKLPFDVGLRGIYFAQPQEAFSGVTRTGLLGSVRQYNSQSMNGFRPNGPKRVTSFDYPWQDVRNIRLDKLKRRMLNAYKNRSYFTMSECQTIVMNTEELATIYHFPGGVATTPTVPRIMSKKSQAPSNLPI